MADFDIQGKITYDATQATSALKGVSQAAGETAKQTDKVGEAAGKAQPQIGQFGSALGLAGQAVGKLSPELGGLVTVAGSATGVIQSLSTAGLGPLGLAVAGVSVAVTAGVGLWKAYVDQQKEAKKRTEDLTKALDDQVKSLDDIIAKNNQIAGDRERAERIAGGRGTREELEANVQRLEQLVNRNQQLVTNATGQLAQAGTSTIGIGLQALGLGPSVDYTEVAMREGNLARATNDLARARAQLTQGLRENFANAPVTPAPTPTGNPPRTGGGGRREAPAASAEAVLYASGGDGGPDILSASEEEALLAGASARGNFLEELAAQARETREAETNQQAQQERENYLAQLDRNRAYLEAREAQEKEAADRLQAINDAVFGALESALSSSVDAWLSGSATAGEAAMQMVKGVAKALTTEAIIQGLKQTALGIGDAASYNYAGAAQHFAAAGTWAAVGVAAGAVGAATGAFGGGGGGGGGAPAAATGGPALTAGAGAGAGTTVVINWGSSGLVYAADRAQLGRDISGMISEAHGRLGRGM
jgi:uncharacterized protein YoxC